jgi:hypothetical protein
MTRIISNRTKYILLIVISILLLVSMYFFSINFALSTSKNSNNTINYRGNVINTSLFNNLTFSQKYTLAYNKNGLNITIPILEYHNVADSIISYYYINTSQFIAQMTYLKRHNFHTITDQQLFSYLNGTGTLPSNPIMLVFDDAQINTFTTVAPILETYGYFAISAVFPSAISNRQGYLTYDSLSDLVNVYNWSIVSHSYFHCLMDTSAPSSNSVIVCNTPVTRESNFSISKIVLQDNLSLNGVNRNITTFIFPFDKDGVNDSEHNEIMSECLSYYKLCIGGISNTSNPVYVTKDSNEDDITRIEINNETTMSDFNNALNFNVSGIVNSNSNKFFLISLIHL